MVVLPIKNNVRGVKVRDMCMISLTDRTDLYNEIRVLISDVNNAEKSIDMYCELILQMFMKQSTNN